MNTKYLETLEFPKILDRLASYTSFSAGEGLARQLRPAAAHRDAQDRLDTTSEARLLLDVKPEVSLGGARDVRPQVVAAQRGAVLPGKELLDVRDTLISASRLSRLLRRLADQFPLLADAASLIRDCPQLVEAINRALDERANVRDGASVELARIRRDERLANDRINEKLRKIITSSTNLPYLQEALVTQREGRYVIPLKADFKGRIRGVVHDMSASGATIYLEPLSVVELNNTWRELQLREEQEVQRILAELSALVAYLGDEVEGTVAALAELDLALAKAKYAAALRATRPELIPLPVGSDSVAADGHPGSTVRLAGARHPLLDPEQVVPIDVVLDDQTYLLIITGPNTGGKTVSLKTVGLLTAMAQAGLHIPVDLGSAVSHFGTIFADIGDEQSIEQSLSTFSGHLANIMSFLDQADRRSLVLLDELGAGTDPAEGAALARALLDHFRARGVTTFVATHYPELKSYAQVTPGAANASVEFDSEALSPTFRLMIGLPGRSNALAIARRLGLPDSIVDEARRIVSHDDRRTEDMLADIDRLRIQMAEARDEASAARSDVQALSDRLRGRLDNIEQERRELLDEARQGIAEEVESLRAEARALRRRLQAAAAPIAAVVEIEKATESLVCETSSVGRDGLPDVPVVSREFRVGDTVWVEPLNATGHVLALGDEEAEVQVGPARTRVRLSAVQFRARPSAGRRSDDQSVPTLRAPAVSSPGVRVDLRGLASDDALDRLDRHLDSAWRAGLPWLHIIHGKGTGTLRRAVRGFLLDHPLVSGYERGGPNEGGEGVTIAKLVER